MFKKILVFTMCALMLCTGLAMAQEEPKVNPLDISSWMEALPDLKQGAVYSVNDKVVKYCSTTNLLVTRYLILEAGAIPINNEAIIAITYELIKLKDHIDVPILDLIELNIGIYGGIINPMNTNEFDWGISATAINVKF